MRGLDFLATERFRSVRRFQLFERTTAFGFACFFAGFRPSRFSDRWLDFFFLASTRFGVLATPRREGFRAVEIFFVGRTPAFAGRRDGFFDEET
jgi:hypothetical protein